MAIEGTYEPSPWEPIVEQVKLYESTGGQEGATLEGVPVIILTTKGRKTGKVRKSPLMRVTDGERYAVVASLGGAPKHPVWYLNLVADPKVVVQDGAEAKEYTARVAEGDERDDWWTRAADVWPSYNDYQTKTDRQIPVVVLDPVG
jgi:deazaflavin-dependent oxidoreductase (nitroreductase family)